MARGRKRGGSSAEKENGGEAMTENGNGGGGGEYEKVREQRIKENREKMEKLGIFNLSQKLKPPPPPPKIPKTSSSKDKALAQLPSRHRRLLAIILNAANAARSKANSVEIACTRVVAAELMGGNQLVKKLGFKSVAHYLIQTHRGQEKTESLVSEDEEPPVLMLDETSDMDENSSGSSDSEVDE
ncbi:hypothetical protein COLO4_11737 [Corchorus olitorius]|uniref:Uncharacterized protein n=1 Tax=Corchorus olitorius TaxID=93759 RepID=A0A1R3K3A7_9ROSI|nr:hypothetical protein COLO4_11737 [Corchorus olitorius]